MNCPECGRQNRPDAAFCMSCGAPLPDVPFAQVEKKAANPPAAGHEGGRPGGEAGAAQAPGPATTANRAGSAGAPHGGGGADARTMPMPAASSAPGHAPGQGVTGPPPRTAPPPQAAPPPTVPPQSGKAVDEAGRTLVQGREPAPGQGVTGPPPRTAPPPQASPAGMGTRPSPPPGASRPGPAPSHDAAGTDRGRSVVEEIRDLERAAGGAAPAGRPAD